MIEGVGRIIIFFFFQLLVVLTDGRSTDARNLKAAVKDIKSDIRGENGRGSKQTYNHTDNHTCIRQTDRQTDRQTEGQGCTERQTDGRTNRWTVYSCHSSKCPTNVSCLRLSIYLSVTPSVGVPFRNLVFILITWCSFSNIGVLFRNLRVPFRNLGVLLRNLGVPFRNLGVPFRNLGVPFRNLGVPFRNLGQCSFL